MTRVLTRGYPLKMWLCSTCGLAQLVGERPWPRSRSALSPSARRTGRGCRGASRPGRLALRPQAGSPSSAAPTGVPGWTWWPARGLTRSPMVDPADLVVDSFGMMHAADQSDGPRRDGLHGWLPAAPSLLQYHSLGTIIRLGQWNALRHGHFAYYSTNALVGMLEARGFVPAVAWVFDLYGGTVLLVATRETGFTPVPPLDGSVDAPLAEDARYGVRRPRRRWRDCKRQAEAHTRGCVTGSPPRASRGETVLGYGAASRAVALQCAGETGPEAPARDRGRLFVQTWTSHTGNRHSDHRVRRSSSRGGRTVLLFVPDLLAEVRRAYP